MTNITQNPQPNGLSSFVFDNLVDAFKQSLSARDQKFFKATLVHYVKLLGVAKVSDAANMTRMGVYKALQDDSNPQFSTMLLLADAITQLMAKPMNVPDRR